MYRTDIRKVSLAYFVYMLKGKKAVLMTSSEKEKPLSRFSKLFVTLEQKTAKTLHFNYFITTDQSGDFLKIAAQYAHALKLD